MLAKKGHLKDGIHCDLCGCTSPAVRCDKCNSQIFCLSCDDMYHRHPKRRLHLRKAVDSVTPNAFRPVTPNKPPPGDPSKMPIPPPRKKKPRNFFGTLMRGSPVEEGPSLPKKEFSWSDKFGTIKRFMSNRPLPPLPVESSPSPEPAYPVGTIYQNVPDKPEKVPILQPRVASPQHSISPSFLNSNGMHSANGDIALHNSTEVNFESDERPLPPPKQYQLIQDMGTGIQRARGGSLCEGGKWERTPGFHHAIPMPFLKYPHENKQEMNHPNMVPGYATFRRPSHQSPHRSNVGSRSPSPSPKEQSSSIHPSTSLTDLHNMPATPGHYPYPYAPHVHQPFLPMFPAHSYAHLNCPQCYSNSWPEPDDNCEYCNSGDDSSHQKHIHRHPESRVKRSQSVMYDGMNNPAPYFPFPPGYGPFYPHGPHFEMPPSPASSTRSLRHAGRGRKRHAVEDNVSVVSSHSRGKSTSSGQLKSPENESMEISSDEEMDNRQRVNSRKSPIAMEVERSTAPPPEQSPAQTWMPSKPWSCEFCTFINPAGIRICGICCKTVSSTVATSDQSLQQNQNYEQTSNNILDNPSTLANESDVPQLSSALAEAEKEMNVEFDKLLKLDQNDEDYGDTKKNEYVTVSSANSNFVETGTSPINSLPKVSHKTQIANNKPENASSLVVLDNVEMRHKEAIPKVTDNDYQFSQKQRKDSSCQTYEDISEVFLERTDKCVNGSLPVTVENGYSGGKMVSSVAPSPNFRSIEVGTSPPPYNHESQPSDRTNIAGMRRSLSRLSLNYGPRPSESKQKCVNPDWLGYGSGEPLYRSISHSSLINESDIWSHEARSFRKPEYYLSVEELVERRRQEAMRAQGLELVRMIREAEQKGFTADDLQVALNNCGKLNAVEWLENNWKNMVETVVTLATNYGHDKRENDIGILSTNEAREALRLHKGNIWAAVTECVESRQRKYLELSARGNFNHKEVVGALTANHGNIELAYAELTKASLKPFLMHIWGPGSGVENESATIPHFLSSGRNDQRQDPNEYDATESKFASEQYEDDSELNFENSCEWADERSDISSVDYEYQYGRSNETGNTYDNRDSEFMHSNRLEQNQEFSFRNEDAKKERLDTKDETKKKRSGLLSYLTTLKKSNKGVAKKEASEKKLNSHSEKVSSKIELNEDNIKTGFQETDRAAVERQSEQPAAPNSYENFTELYATHDNLWVQKESNEIVQNVNSPKLQHSASSKHKDEKRPGIINIFKSLSSEKSKPDTTYLAPKEKSKTTKFSDTSDKKLTVSSFSGKNDKEMSEIKLNNIPNEEIENTDKNSNESSPSTIQYNAGSKKELSPNIPSSCIHPVSLQSLDGNLLVYDETASDEINSNDPEIKDENVDIIKQDSQENDKNIEISPPESPTKVEQLDEKLFNNKKGFYIEQYKNKLQNKDPFNSSSGSGAVPKSASKKPVFNNKAPSKLNLVDSKPVNTAQKDVGISSSSKKFEFTSLQKKVAGKKTTSEHLNKADDLVKTKVIDEINKTSNSISKTNAAAEKKISTTKSGVTTPLGKDPKSKKETNSPLMGMKNLLTKTTPVKQETKTMTEATKKSQLKKEMSASQSLLKKKEDSLGRKRTWMSPLQKVNDKQLMFERKVRRYLAEEKCSSYEKAEIAVHLVEMDFNEDDVLQSMQECTTLDQALGYLQQDCELCVGVYPASKMVAMVHCPHRACMDCLTTYFTIQIRDRNIRELMCPYCNEPDLDNEDIAMDYFNHLDIMLKTLVDPDIHELFQQKLRDRVLMKDPCFRWCSQCSSGFIGNPDLIKLTCPDCKAVTCAKCRRLWEKQHDEISCEQFAAWKDVNDPEAQAAGLAKHLTDNGIGCPNCKFRYSLAKGGCMHFRCIQCQYDFCSGCSKPFKMGQKCTVSEFCAKLGLHAHHPRNCLFYLRDKDPEDLQTLLDEYDIDYDTEPSEGMDIRDECQVMEQKETPQGMKDDICGKEVKEGYAGLCRIHYVEYLGQLVNKYNVDPLPVFSEDDLELVLRRANKRLPSKQFDETFLQYRDKLTKIIQENVPLENQDDS